MPQTTLEIVAERSARWGTDADAIEFLADAGYTLNGDCSWNKPCPDHEPTTREIDAIVYLIEEWDFEGLRGIKSASQAIRYFGSVS